MNLQENHGGHRPPLQPGTGFLVVSFHLKTAFCRVAHSMRRVVVSVKCDGIPKTAVAFTAPLKLLPTAGFVAGMGIGRLLPVFSTGEHNQ
jgi:hypothetical protein